MKQKTIIEKDGSEVIEYSFEYEDKTLSYKIQEPTFAQLSAALTETTTGRGKLNMAGGGKVIFALCCKECSPEIEADTKLLVSVCLDLYERYVNPVDIEIKKN